MALTQISTQGIKDGTITGTDLATNVDLVDNQKLRLGTGNDLQIYHDGSHSYIQDTGTGNLVLKGTEVVIQSGGNSESKAIFKDDGAVELYHNDSKKFETHSGGVNVTGSVNPTGNVALLDNSKLKLGTGDDLQIFHDGSTSLIKSANHALAYYSNTRHHFLNGDGSENMAVFVADGQCELYHNGTSRINRIRQDRSCRYIQSGASP